MLRRTTIEIDERLLEHAKRALGLPTIRATVEEALRRVTADVEDARGRVGEAQATYFADLPTHADVEILGSEETWR